MSRVIVAGSIAYDRIMDYGGNFTDAIVADKLHALSVSFQVETIQENFGGCAGNIAYNLALLGGQSEIIATGGSDFGRYADYLKQQGIDPSSIHIDAFQLTSVAHIVTDKANNQIAAFAMAAGAKPYGKLPDTKNSACAILGAGNVPDTIALAAHAKQHDLPYYFDPGQALPVFSEDSLKGIISGAAGLFGNDYELGLIEKKTGWDQKQLLEKTPLVVMTLGGKGSRVMTSVQGRSASGGKEGTINIPAVPVEKVIDPTGAGDAHRAGFVKGIIGGLSLKECGQLASTVAAYAVEHQGTQNHRFTMEELRERHKSVYGERLPL
jgi:adenosine kinase